MPISADTFARAPTKVQALELTKTIQDYKWSNTDIFLTFITLGSYAAVRALYQFGYNEDKKVEQYLRGNVALFNVYKNDGEENQSVQIIDGKKQITVDLDGYPLTLKETGTKEQPTLTYEYKNRSSCTGDNGIYITLDAWMLTEFSKMKTDNAYFELYSARGLISKEERVNFYPDQFKTDTPNFVNVDFTKLTPAEGLDFSGIALNNPKFSGSRLSNIDFSGAQIVRGDFTNVTFDTVQFNRVTVNCCNFLGAIFKGEVDFRGAIFDRDIAGMGLRTSFPQSTDFNSEYFKETKFQKEAKEEPTHSSNQNSYSPKQGGHSNRSEHTRNKPGEQEKSNISAENRLEYIPPTLNGCEEIEVGQDRMIQEACKILGIANKPKENLTYKEFRLVVKDLLKNKHPDRGGEGNTASTQEILDAKTYLENNAYLSKKWEPEKEAMNLTFRTIQQRTFNFLN